MGQKFFISFNSADQTKAHWIAWTLKEAGHEVAVHDWEIPAGGNAPLWMNSKLAWADRLIAVISPEYVPTRYSPMEDARRRIAEAQAMIEATRERWIEAEIHCTAGEILLKSQARDEPKALSYFERALAIAQKQQAKSWELRAAMSMARLWRDQGKRDEARDLLAPVYGWFTEGFDTRDLKEAKALLEELDA